MGEWHKTGCVLCAQNCGLEVYIENNRIEKVKGDKSNPRSRGYVCRKGVHVAHHQHHAQRLTHPLKKSGDSFVKISWEEAIGEIAEKFKRVVDEHGPRSFAYMGGGGQGCHFEAAFGVTLLRGLGSHYHYNALAQELTGIFWAQGRLTGKQYLFSIPDEHETEMLFGIGWNGMVSHQMPRAPLVLKEMAKNPDKLLVIVDPRESETAQIADIHLAVRPGTDALMLRAMIRIILEEGWEKKEYIKNHVDGFDRVKPWFEGFDARRALEVCELDYEMVRTVCKELCERKASMHPDLGIYMNRHSTATTYLLSILMAISGNACVPGGNVIPGTLMPLGGHSDERDPKTWRTVETNFPALMGYFPPNVMPEEIMSDKPERLRALLCSQSNPLRSYADTTAYEEAFKKLDILVTCELAMTETAQLSDYVLPARSGYESWDGTFFPWTYPEVFFQMRRPIVEPEGEPLEVGEIITRIADSIGLIPEIPQSLVDAAEGGNRLQFGMELMKRGKEDPAAFKIMPFILAKTLGKKLGSGNLAALWGLLMTAPKSLKENALRIGFKDSPILGDELFQAIVDTPQGLWIGKCDVDNNFASIQHEDGKLHIHAPEMEEWILGIEPEAEERELTMNKEYPFILLAGRHMAMNANTLMRDPSWNEGKRACTCAMHPVDAEAGSFADGQMVQVSTEAGSVTVELEITKEVRKGQVLIPHGFGLDYNGEVYGVNVNRLTKNTHRDPFAATPLHRYVPCKVEAV
ncbi:MAG: molybdopterin-dependent oxidoreductase [bacterium]|nr:molybdopterin-dependent oxidoreductase [bacterium]